MVTAHPRVLGHVLRLTLTCLLVLSPLIAYVAMRVPGISVSYECTQLEREISDAQLVRRHLLAERAKLVAPEQLRARALELGLVPADIEQRPGAASAPRLPRKSE